MYRRKENGYNRVHGGYGFGQMNEMGNATLDLDMPFYCNSKHLLWGGKTPSDF